MTGDDSDSQEVAFTSIYTDERIEQRVAEVLQSKRYVKGPLVEKFESRFANYSEANHAAAVSNGTAALLLALKASGIGEDDGVLVPAHTYFATVSPILKLGASPLFVDVDSDRYTMDPAEARNVLADTDSVSAMLVTHMHGQPAEMDELRSIADKHDLTLIEDAAQAHGARIKGKRVGSLGDLACFSFYPSKNMTVAGDGGMVTSDDPDAIQRVKQFRNHGRNDAGEHVRLGLNYRLDETNAAVGLEQLDHLDDWNDTRRDAARIYDDLLADVEPVVTPTEGKNSEHVYHHYPIQVPDRSEFRTMLDEAGIETGVHYDQAVHQHEAVAERVSTGDHPTAERLCERTVSLPMHPRIDDAAVRYVCDRIEGYYR